MPNCERDIPADSEPEIGEPHDWCLATRLCRRCGASQSAVARGDRARACEPGVTGISWTRAAERIAGQMEMAGFGEAFGPLTTLPLYRLGDLVPGRVVVPDSDAPLTGKRADLIIIDDPDEPPPSAA